MHEFLNLKIRIYFDENYDNIERKSLVHPIKQTAYIFRRELQLNDNVFSDFILNDRFNDDF